MDELLEKGHILIDRYYKFIKILIMVCAYAYLAYVLVNFKGYNEFFNSFKNISAFRTILLVLAVLLIPCNWLLESMKWQHLSQKLQPVSLCKAYKSVLMGLTVGFFTPNRIGDPLGRVLILNACNRTKGIVLSVIGVLGQTFSTLVCGLTAGILLIVLSPFESIKDSLNIQIASILLIIAFISLYFTLPIWGKILFQRNRFKRLRSLLEAISYINPRSLFYVTFLSLIRYIVYCSQYYFLLRFFDVELSLTDAAMILPLNYLMVSVTPTIAFSELGVRGSYAVLFVGAFASNTVGAALAGMSVWFINYVIPMMVGSIFVGKMKKQGESTTANL